MKKRIIALLLAFCVMAPFLSQNVFSNDVTAYDEEAYFSDMKSHWALETVAKWVESGLISGYNDKTFKPDRNISRAEFCVLVDKIFGYQDMGDTSFNDIKKSDWYSGQISRVKEAGIIAGYNNSFNPDSPLTRQDAAVIIQKAFELAKTDDTSAKNFKDYSSIKEYANEAISALVSKGYIKGFEDNTIKPLKNLSRAEAVAIIDNAAGMLVNQKGIYSNDTVEGNLLINSPDVTIKDMNIKGNLYLTEGIGEGEVTIDSVVVEGVTFVKGGGSNSVVIKNSHLSDIIVKKKKNSVRIAFEGNTTAASVKLLHKAKVEFSEETSISKLEVEKDAEGTVLTGKGTVKTIEVKAENVLINNNIVKVNAGYTIEAGNVKDQNGDVIAPVSSPSVQPSSSPSESSSGPSSGSYTSAPTPAPAPSPWTLVWADEFDTGTINTDNWTVVDTGVVYNNEKEYYKPENAYIQDGKLVLEARKETYGGKEYTSSKLITKGKQSWKYGRFEIRAKMPKGQGIWPAIWMLPEDDNIFGGWPQGGEIDILELLGHEPDKIYGTLHYGNPHASGQGSYTLSSGNFSEAYHVYALEWEPGEMRWYIDGILYHTENSWFSRNTAEADSYTYPAPFNREFHLILNLAVGGDWPGDPDETTVFPEKMYVDYTRVYTLTGRPYREAGERPDNNNSQVREPLEDGNYIYNSSFDQEVEGVAGIDNNDGNGEVPNTSYWTFSHVEANDGIALISNDNGALKIDISDPGTNTYSVQIYQKPINIEKTETYRVSFDAWASEPRNMVVKVGAEADRGWSNYSGDQTVELTDSSQNFEFQFKMLGDTNTAARLEFNAGNAGVNTVWIDNVRIEKLPKDPNAPREALTSGNLVYNGSFDQGSESMGYWEFQTYDGAVAEGSVNPDIYNREFRAVISNGGTDEGSIVLLQNSLNIENGKEYKVTFSARADSNRSIEVNIGSSSDDSVSYSGRQSIDLTTEMKPYSFRFNMPETSDTNAQLQFNLGGDIGTVYIDNVSVKNILPSRVIHVEAEDSTLNGATLQSGYVSFSTNSSVVESVYIPETTYYTISYYSYSNTDTGWLSVTDSVYNNVYKVSVPKTGDGQDWTIVTNTLLLAEGTQNITISGENINLDWFELSKEIITDGSMDSSSANWGYWATAGEAAIAAKSTEDGKLKIAITSPGANPWSIGLNQQGIGLERGRLYRMSFDAMATIDRSIRITLDKADYSKYLSKDFELTSTMKNYVLDFSMDYDSDNNTAFVFSLGNISGTLTEAHDIYIDNVRITEIEDIICQDTQVKNAPVVTNPSIVDNGDEGELSNLITDGTFDSDIGSWTSYSGGGEVTLSVSDGKLLADVASVGTNNYEPQVVKNNISLSNGTTYVLAFNASASTDKAVEVSIIDPADNYRYYGGGKYTLSTTSSDYAFVFTAPDTTSSAALQFNLGSIEGQTLTSVAASVYLDNVSLTTAINVVDDGTFDSDIGLWTSYSENGSTQLSAEDGKLSVNVTGVGNVNYDPQIKRGSMSFVKDGIYVVAFSSMADVDRAVEVNIIDPGDSYRYYGGNKYVISASSQDNAFVFTAPGTTDTAEIGFNFGLIGGYEATSVAASVYLDNVIITPIYIPESGDSNQLLNETFDSGIGVWGLSENGGAATVEVLNNELSINVVTVGANNYQPQINASNISLQSGVSYTFTFKAKADTPRGIEIAVLDPSNGYHWYGGSKVDLTTELQTYTVSFTADASTSTAVIQINFGTIEGKTSVPAAIYIDDTILTKQ